jgi:hypothetical protein
VVNQTQSRTRKSNPVMLSKVISDQIATKEL